MPHNAVMRLAWDVTPLSVPMTGIGRYTRDAILAVAEARPGWQLRLICVAEQSGCDLATAAFRDAPPGIEVVPVVRSPAVLTRRFATRFGRPTIEKWVGSVDAVIDSEWFRPMQQSGSRLTVVHDLIPYRFPEWVDARTRRAHLRAMKTMAYRVDRVMVNSHATARDLARFVGIPEERSTVVYPALDPIFATARPITPVVVNGRPYAVAVGTTNRRKNLEIAIRALAYCDADLALVVVGASADAEGEIAALALACGVSDRVHRLGYVADGELASIVSAARCLVFPSRFEGFGLPIIEAMSAGVPVIASLDPSLDEACGDSALRVDPDDVEGLAQAMTAPDTSLIPRGRSHAAQFTYERTGESVAVAIETA